LVSLEKAEKLPAGKKYFNISVLWIFYYKAVLNALYKLRVPHESVSLFSIFCGFISAWFFYHGNLIAAVVVFHLKDIFDACDGALARLTGRGHLIGRYLDSVGDFFSITAVILAIAIRASQDNNEIYLFWGAAAVLSTFIQCSFFNYYQLSYLELYGINRLASKRDEINRSDISKRYYEGLQKPILAILRFFYIAIFSWQDKLVKYIDQKILGGTEPQENSKTYGNKTFMTLQSALCFGTHIFIIILFGLIGKPRFALIFIATIMNFYLVLLLYFRGKAYRRRTSVNRSDSSTGIDILENRL